MKNIENELLSAAEAKLELLLAEHNLIHSFKTNQYPIMLSIKQNLDPSVQMEIYETAGDDVSARDSRLTLTFKDGAIIVRTDSRLIITDDLLNKIKSHAKKMHYLYLQGFHRSCCQRFEETPVYEDDEDAEDDSEE